VSARVYHVQSAGRLNTRPTETQAVSDEGYHIAAATAEDIDDITDCWVALARDQRRHGSTLLATANRSAVREWVAKRAVTGELLTAHDAGDGAPGDESSTDSLIGFVGFSLEHGAYERDCTRGVISALFVVPSRRGAGVGSALLTAAEDALADAGADAVVLEALAANDRGRSFYADHGYDVHRVELRKPVEDERDTTTGTDDTG